MKLADEIAAGGGAAPIVIPCDLEQPDAGDKIAAALAAEAVEVEFVVNNSGFGLFGNAIELDRAEQLGIIAVNIRAMTDLSLRFSDHLIRHRGGILNVGSIAGFLPGPGMAVYYASKAYVLSFSEALRGELASRDPEVQRSRCRAGRVSRADGQQAGRAARPRHQDRAASAPAVSPRVCSLGGRAFSAAEALINASGAGVWPAICWWLNLR